MEIEDNMDGRGIEDRKGEREKWSEGQGERGVKGTTEGIENFSSRDMRLFCQCQSTAVSQDHSTRQFIYALSMMHPAILLRQLTWE